MTLPTRGGLLLVLWLLAGLAQAGTRHYYYTDPQGTPLAKTDANGTVISTYDYAPYGAPVAGLSGAPNGPGYTGHVNDPDTGFVYMQARYYDPAVGRFLSIDPVPASPGNFNRYWYANNNPYKFIDPDGRDSFLVSRPLDNAAASCCASHNFVVSNADYVGDPKATVYSFGKTSSGNTGRVDESTKGFSEGTARKDQNFWKGMAEGKAVADKNTTLIEAPDAVVDKVAESIVENTAYSALPSGGKTNSNSAASAVANRAQGSSVSVPGGARLSPGAGQFKKIKFKNELEK
jgi:RHS repeat-associated protein